MGKEKAASGDGLGRALVRRHNQMVQQSKEKGAAARLRHRAPIESITEVTDIDAILEQSTEGGDGIDPVHPFDRRNSPAAAAISLDGFASPAEERRREREAEEALHAGSLRVPRRPLWTPDMSIEDLDANERRAFLAWRKGFARLEENEKLIITPFEKNLEIWRQLWRVLERSDLLVMVVDARDPLFYRCPDLEAYAREIDESKRTLLLINKADLLPSSVRREWAKYFHVHGILHIFWSAKAASAALEDRFEKITLNVANLAEESDLGEDAKIYGRDELLSRLQAEAEAALSAKHSQKGSMDEKHVFRARPESKSTKHVVVGFVGYPNVGKSSTINALAGEKRAGVTSTPGKTKHFQTIIISERLMLCDCPGLVFPSFSSSRYEMIASGVLPIDRMTNHREAVQVVANHVPRWVLESVYKIKLPKPKQYESPNKPPSGQEILRAYCSSRGYVISRGLPDETRAARQILKDYVDGKLPHFKLPPGTTDSYDFFSDVLSSLGISEASEVDTFHETSITDTVNNGSDKMLESAMDELRSFDTLMGTSSAAAPPKKKAITESHKHHKKPQRKKDRSWRVGNDDGDGMPIVGVFQKPCVNRIP